MSLTANTSLFKNDTHSGVAALIITLMIWSSYFVALRSGAQSVLTAYDMAMLRFFLPALVLLPVLIKARKKIMTIRKRYLIGIVSGAGLPFYLLSVLASSHVEAVVGSLLVPGVAPVFVTMIAVICYKERLSKRRLIGLLCVLGGVSVLLSKELASSSEQLLGPLLYLTAAALWAVYTISVRVCALSSLEVAAVLNISAALVLLLVMPTNITTSNLMSAPLSEVLTQLLIMGVFCGLISIVTYAHSIQKLGAELSACWGALTPVLVAIIAYFLLAEYLDFNQLIAMLIIFSGVIFANVKTRN